MTTLPAPGQQMVTFSLVSRGPSGGSTPLGPALQGAVNALKKHLAAHPGHKAVLVVATDGSPSGCIPGAIPDIAKILVADRMGANPVTTYVIGVYGPQDMTSRNGIKDLSAAAARPRFEPGLISTRSSSARSTRSAARRCRASSRSRRPRRG